MCNAVCLVCVSVCMYVCVCVCVCVCMRVPQPTAFTHVHTKLKTSPCGWPPMNSPKKMSPFTCFNVPLPEVGEGGDDDKDGVVWVKL